MVACMVCVAVGRTVFDLLFVIGGDYFTYTRHEPVGVCGQIIPVSNCQLLTMTLTIIGGSDGSAVLLPFGFTRNRLVSIWYS